MERKLNAGSGNINLAAYEVLVWSAAFRRFRAEPPKGGTPNQRWCFKAACYPFFELRPI